MSEPAQALPFWTALERLGRQHLDARGEVDLSAWSLLCGATLGQSHVRAWVLTEDAATSSPTFKPDPRKRYALEACLNGKLERKFVVGAQPSHAAFREVLDYLTGGAGEALLSQVGSLSG